MNINQLKESKFLKKEDCGKGILVTIKGVTQENIAKEGVEPEYKWVLHFDETEKPMVLNSTNGQLIAAILKSDESDDWTGHKIVLYHDPNVSFGGKLIGGIRVRAPRGQANITPASQRKPAPPPPPAEDDVPF